jgi:hypothetical protein
MYKYLLIFMILVAPTPILHSSDDAISQFTYGYLKRINDYIDDENYVEAQRDLDIFVRRYFLNEQSYEMARSLMERFDTPEEIMNESLKELKEVDNFSIVNQAKSYVSGLIMQAVIGLLIGLIFKKTDPNAID